MGSKQTPKVKIKLYPENLVQSNKLQILQNLQKTNALILNLAENIKGNVFNQPIPFITFQRVLPSEQLPNDVKLDGDPWSDYFIQLQSFKRAEASTRNPSSSGILSLN